MAILEWLAIPFSRGSSRPRDRIQVSCIAGRFFTIRAPRKASIGLESAKRSSLFSLLSLQSSGLPLTPPPGPSPLHLPSGGALSSALLELRGVS